MPHVLVAPDKFRGTATAAEIAASAADAARAAGWTADEAPMADGGEGTLEALVRAAGARGAPGAGCAGHLGGAPRSGPRTSRVAGPLGDAVTAGWWLLADTASLPLPAPLVPGDDPTAVIEAAEAAGRALVPHPRDDQPLRASTSGVGELLAAAADAGARQVILAVGGSASTDGGAGALHALGGPERLGGCRVVVACDVRTPFREAAAVFGPQKGATPAQVAQLSERLRELAVRYRTRYGVDVDSLPGSGAAGGLAGGLAAMGATLVAGFPLVAAASALGERLAAADLVVTGEGHLDATSFDGKVVGGVLAAAGGRVPALCVVGAADPGMRRWWAGRAASVRLVTLTDAVGRARAMQDTAGAVAGCVAEHLDRAGRTREGTPGPAVR